MLSFLFYTVCTFKRCNKKKKKMSTESKNAIQFLGKLFARKFVLLKDLISIADDINYACNTWVAFNRRYYDYILNQFNVRINNGTQILRALFGLIVLQNISWSMFLRSKARLQSRFHRPYVSHCVTLPKKTCLESILDARELQDFRGHDLFQTNTTDFFFERNNQNIIVNQFKIFIMQKITVFSFITSYYLLWFNIITFNIIITNIWFNKI